MPKQSDPRFLTRFQAACLSDSFGRASIIDIIYDHPKGITFRGIKRIEDRKRKRHYAKIDTIFHKIQKSQLEKFLKDLVDADLAIEKEGYYDLFYWFRNFLNQVMERAKKEHPELFAKKKGG